MRQVAWGASTPGSKKNRKIFEIPKLRGNLLEFCRQNFIKFIKVVRQELSRKVLSGFPFDSFANAARKQGAVRHAFFMYAFKYWVLV